MATSPAPSTGLQSELTRLGYTLLLACSEYDFDQEFRQVKKFVERGVDAILLVGELHHHNLEEFLPRNDVPMLNMFVYNPKTHGTSIGPDNHKALYRLTRHLIDFGHRRFGVIAQDSDDQRSRQGAHPGNPRCAGRTFAGGAAGSFRGRAMDHP